MIVPRSLQATIAGAVGAAAADEVATEQLSVLTAGQAKGLEFDAVVLVEPAAILGESPRGVNDLYVAPEARGRGIGRALIEASAAVARERGAAWLEWATAPDNHTAQRLYDSMTSEKSTWLEYELDL